MIKVEELAQWLEDGYNDNDKGISFSIVANNQDFKEMIRSGLREEVSNDVYGVLRAVTSEAEPVKDLNVYIIGCELELAVTTDTLEKNSLKTVYDILQKHYEFYLGTSAVLDEYTITIDTQFPQVGDTELNTLGELASIYSMITFTVTKNTIGFNETKFYLDGAEMKEVINWNYNISKAQEKYNSAETTINNNYFTSQTLVFNFTVPQKNVDWLKELYLNLYKDRELNKVYELKIESPFHEGIDALIYNVRLAEYIVGGSPASINSNGLVFVECTDEE